MRLGLNMTNAVGVLKVAIYIGTLHLIKSVLSPICRRYTSWHFACYIGYIYIASLSFVHSCADRAQK